MTYTHKIWPDVRCTQCSCQLPTDDRGYCQRCNEGWDVFYTDECIEAFSYDGLEQQRSLILYYYTTAERRDDRDAMILLVDLLKKIERRLTVT